MLNVIPKGYHHRAPGYRIEKVNTESRKALEKFFDKKIFLETFVKLIRIGAALSENLMPLDIIRNN